MITKQPHAQEAQEPTSVQLYLCISPHSVNVNLFKIIFYLSSAKQNITVSVNIWDCGVMRWSEGLTSDWRNEWFNTAEMSNFNTNYSGNYWNVCFGVNLSMLQYKNERQHLKTWHLLSFPPNSHFEHSDLMQQQKQYKLIYVHLKPRKAFPQIKWKLPWFSPSLPSFQRPSSSSLSSAHLAQPVVCLGVGDDGLNGYDGLVDLGLELPQLLDVQQAQDLGRFVQSRVWGEMYFTFPQIITFYVPHTAPQTPCLSGRKCTAITYTNGPLPSGPIMNLRGHKMIEWIKKTYFFRLNRFTRLKS